MADIEKIKSHPDAHRLFASRVQLTRKGGGWMGKCPWHDDNEDSLSVFQEKGSWMCRCHAGCKINDNADDGKIAGNVVQFVAKFDGVSIAKAAKIAEDELAGSWGAEKADVERVFRPVSSNSKTYRTIDLKTYSCAETNLQKSTEAQEFLKSRGITMETARKLKLGFSQYPKNGCGGHHDVADQGWIVFPCFEGDRVVSVKYRSIVKKCFFRESDYKTVMFNMDSCVVMFVIEIPRNCLPGFQSSCAKTILQKGTSARPATYPTTVA
jgi:DNA primase